MTFRRAGEGINMFGLIIGVVTTLLLSGCAATMQPNLDQLGAFWWSENQKLLEQMGTRSYPLERMVAHRAMLVALTNLEMIVEDQDSQAGFIMARGNAPRPLSMQEWKRVEQIEAPIIRSYVGFPVAFTPENKEIIVNAFILERQNDVQITLRFRKKQLGNTYGLTVTDQAPPEAVRIALPKVWDEFERVAFIQGKVFEDSTPYLDSNVPEKLDTKAMRR